LLQKRGLSHLLFGEEEITLDVYAVIYLAQDCIMLPDEDILLRDLIWILFYPCNNENFMIHVSHFDHFLSLIWCLIC
jgi:hypothetical protein